MKELQTLSILSPGFFGINTQESGVTLSPNFAQLTDNVIIDKYGRLGARKGWTMKTTSGNASLAGNPLEFMLEHVNADNSVEVLSAGNNKLFKGGAEGDVLVNITPAAYTITANNWKGASLNDHALLAQKGHEPVLVTAESGTLVADRLSTHTAHGAHTPSYGTNYPRDVIAGYGRFWVHDGSTVYWSDDIAGNFPRFDGGSSGLLNIASVLPNNVDTIVALAVHNNFLIIFCRHNIIVYSGADNPLGTFGLNDVIVGVGCISRDSVVHTGSDLIFLSDTGVRSLGRVIQEKSLPVRDLTKNIRDDLITDILEEQRLAGSTDNVCGVYSETNAFYLLSFPATETVFVLDMRQALEDGSARITVWYSYKASSFLRRRNRDLLIGKIDGIGLYGGYDDNNESYRLRYSSHYLDLGAPTTVKMLKQIKATVVGGSNQSFVIKAGFDYTNNTKSYPFRLDAGAVFEYGVTEYNIGSYSVGIVLDTVKSSVGGSGNTIQIGFEADVNGDELSIQKLDIFLKTGRTI